MNSENNKASWWQVFKSVAASMLGVQSEANYQSDFEQPSIVPYVVVGVFFVLALIGLLLLIVNIFLAR
jgi:diacylglycerol kinase